MWKPIILDVECIVCNKSLQKINHDPREVTRKMGKIANRRSRTPNWSVEEKQYLLELIKERKDVVVHKTNNGPNHYEEKDVAWNEILRELAIKFGNKFIGSSTKKVKTQWQNMKRIAREEITLNGPDLGKFSRQSLEVCNILDLVRDGVLRAEGENMTLNDTTMTTNIEIKAEIIDEETNQPGCSRTDEHPMEIETIVEHQTSPVCKTSAQPNPFESSSSSVSEQISDANEFESQENPEPVCNKKCISVNASTETTFFDDVHNVNPFHRDFQEFFRQTEIEKQLKLDSLKEERQVIRAMRETAELNKIIAEQRLKHVLWMKKQEMVMYSGEPGSGAGRGGGAGGAIREAGGSFGKMEAAKEEQYFYNKQREQLKELKSHLDKEIAFHQEQIKRHEDAIKRHKDQMADMDKK